MRANLKLLILLLIVLIFEILPYTYGFPHIFTILHDNLENDVVRAKLLADSGKLWASNKDIIPNMMCGLPRLSYNSALYYIPWLFYFFDPYYAYIINVIFIHIIGFIGVYVLSNQTITIKDEKLKFITCTLISLIYSYQLEYPNFGLSLAILPWILSIILVNQKIKWYHYLIVIIIPFTTLFTHYGVFLLIFLFLYLFFEKFYIGSWNKKILYLIMYLVPVYILVEYRLILAFFGDSSFVSHRTEHNLSKLNISDAIIPFFKLLVNGYYQAPYFTHILILFLIILKLLKIKIDKNMIFILSLFLIFCSLSIFYNTIYFNFISQKIKIFKMLDMSRFYTVTPGFVLVLYLYSLNHIFSKNIKYLNYFVVLLLSINLYLNIRHNHTFKDFFKKIVNISSKPEMNTINHAYLDEFYAQDIFNKIKAKINYNTSFRVGSIGLHPGIALFNGFYTIDGVISNYPLDYKKKFRKIIENELNKNEKIKKYFDEYGNRAYLFSSELSQTHLFLSSQMPTIKNLELDNIVLKQLNCKYIFSSVIIENADKLNWNKVLEIQNNTYRIIVYEIQ